MYFLEQKKIFFLVFQNWVFLVFQNCDTIAYFYVTNKKSLQLYFWSKKDNQ